MALLFDPFLMNPKTYHIVSLGCAKNTVDFSAMAQLMSKSGYQILDDPELASLLIVNTCGFIAPAREAIPPGAT